MVFRKICTYCGERRNLYDDFPHRNSIKSNDPIRSKRNYVDSRFSNFNKKDQLMIILIIETTQIIIKEIIIVHLLMIIYKIIIITII